MHSFEHFKFYAQKVLPMVYDESLSYYEVLEKVAKYLNDVIENQVELETLFGASSLTITSLQKEVDYLLSEFEKIKSGTYVSLYINSLAQWIDSNLSSIIERAVNYIVPLIDDTGHYCIDVIYNEDKIHFDWDAVPTSDSYGCIILSY